MADAVTSQTIVDGERNCIMKFTNVSDGTGESAVAKVDVSALGTDNAGRSCSEVRILRISHAIVGMSVQLFFNAMWSWLFFRFQMPLMALLDIYLLIVITIPFALEPL